MDRETSFEGVSRRDFIKTSALSLAALCVTDKAFAAGSDTVRIGLIGCG